MRLATLVADHNQKFQFPTVISNIKLLEPLDGGLRSPSAPVLKSLKCPACAEFTNSYENLNTYFPRTPILIGLRHPVLWFESIW